MSKIVQSTLSATESVAHTLTTPSKMTSLVHNNEILLVSGLFLALSPGLIFDIPNSIPLLDRNSVHNLRTSHISVVVHSLIFALILFMLKKNYMNTLTSEKIMFATLLFIAVSPGMLFEIPSARGHRTFTNNTSNSSILVHSLIFMIIYGSTRN